MTKDEIALKIDQLKRIHSGDGDGGYEMVSGILRFDNQLDDNDQRKLNEHLLELVASEAQGLWGIALEALVQKASPEVPARLERLFRLNKGNQEWRRQLILGMLRLGYDKALDICLPFIEASVNQNDPFACILLAHICFVDPELCVELSSKFFSQKLASTNGLSNAEGCIPSFVYNFAKKDDLPLIELVKRTLLINQVAGKRLANIISDYLSKPWIVTKFGQEKVCEMQRAMLNVDDNSGSYQQ